MEDLLDKLDEQTSDIASHRKTAALRGRPIVLREDATELWCLVMNSTPRPRCCGKTVSLPRKRKRSPASSSSRPLVQPPENSVPHSALSLDDLPVASKMPPRPQPRNTDHQLTSSGDSSLKIHNLSVEEYQRVYHEVVDSMLTYNSGRPRPYSLELGRRIKQKLWERLNRPSVETSTNKDGLQQISMVYGQEVNPPHYDIDISS